jgi:hypothetical protein
VGTRRELPRVWDLEAAGARLLGSGCSTPPAVAPSSADAASRGQERTLVSRDRCSASLEAQMQVRFSRSCSKVWGRGCTRSAHRSCLAESLSGNALHAGGTVAYPSVCAVVRTLMVPRRWPSCLVAASPVQSRGPRGPGPRSVVSRDLASASWPAWPCWQAGEPRWARPEAADGRASLRVGPGREPCSARAPGRVGLQAGCQWPLRMRPQAATGVIRRGRCQNLK